MYPNEKMVKMVRESPDYWTFWPGLLSIRKEVAGFTKWHVGRMLHPADPLERPVFKTL